MTDRILRSALAGRMASLIEDPEKMKIRVAFAASLLLVAGSACPAQRQKHAFVQIQSDASSELCVAASKAVSRLREGATERLIKRWGDPATRVDGDLPVEGLLFHSLQTRQFTTVDDAAVQRTPMVSYYRLDLDDDGSVEMITLASGGHGPAGEGDTLTVLEHDLVPAPQPVHNEEFIKVTLEIGGRTHTFYGKDLQFDPAYFMYPFSFQGKNYLLIEGNRAFAERRHLVVRVRAGGEIHSLCYF